MRLIASGLALKIVMALRHTGPASLAELADVLRVRPSSCQRALEVLLADRLVVGIGEGRAREYVLEDRNRTLAAVEEIVDATVPEKEALVILGNANPAVELIGLTSNRMITIFAKRSATADRSRAAAVIKRLAEALKLTPQFFDHNDLVRAPNVTIQLRNELSCGEVLMGQIDRSIPDRSKHRKTAGRALGHVSPALHLPSARTIQSIKRRPWSPPAQALRLRRTHRLSPRQ